MKLVIIFGASAAGKMTVTQELSKITDLKVFNNHMSIEPVLELFGEFNTDAIFGIRDAILKNFVFTDNYGIIHTFLYDFDNLFCAEYIDELISLYESMDADVYLVELDCPLSERIKRNETENRLFHKPSKRDIEISTKRIYREEQTGRFESRIGEISHKHFIKINNERLSAEDTAKLIKTVFKL